jgi:hypothetical protein
MQRCRVDVKPYLAVLVLLAMWAGSTAFAASPADIYKGTWANCGIAVKTELQKNPQDPKAVVELGNLWAAAYDKQYEWLRAKGRLQQSTPDADKIFETVKSKLDPIEVASDKLKDKALEALVKRYFSRLAPLVKFAGGPIGEALKAFFNSSEIATDYDELRLMNDDIQQRVALLLQPYLKPNWQSLVDTAARQAAPAIRQR